MIVFERLLSLVADRPEGAKINISALRREFTPSHEEMVAAISRLVASNRLDPQTLRHRVAQPKKSFRGIVRGLAQDAEPTAALWDDLEAERQRRGISRMAVSIEIWGTKTRIYRLLDRPTCRAETARKIRAWINSEVQERRPPPALAQPPEPRAAQEGDGETARGDREHAIAEDSPSPINSRITDPAVGSPHGPAVPSVDLPPMTVESRAEAVAPVVIARPAFEDSAPVDINGNASRRDPTKPPPGYYADRPGAIDLTEAVISSAQAAGAPKRSRTIKEAQSRIDRGLGIGGRGIPAAVKIAQAGLEKQIEDEARLADPVEQAKAKLRRRFSPVVSAEFADPPGRKGQFRVGRHTVSRAELLKMAGIGE